VMQKTVSACRRKWTVTFIPNRVIGAIDADNCHADWASATSPELRDLISKIVDYTINLFDHCLCQHLDFNSDLNCGNRSPRNQIPRINYWGFARDDLAKSPITTPRSNTTPLVLCIQNAVLTI